MCRIAFYGLIMLAISNLFLSSCGKQQHGKPNFLILLIDDLGVMDVGCYGKGIIETPNIDKLAAEGMKWTNAYAACPVCSPTRAAILTGKSPARIHFTGHITAIERHRCPENSAILPPEDKMYIPYEEIMLSEALKPAGYISGSFGKWHVGGPGFWPTDQGFDVNVGGWTHGSPPSHFYPYERPGSEWNASIPTLHGGQEGEYLTDRLTDEAIGFIRENLDRPFLVYLSHYAVHTPLEAPEALIDKYKPLTKNTGIDPVYAAMVESVDQNIGRILASLEDLGLSENTVVIFASDNGGLERVTNNQPYRKGKGHLYEGGIRVPFIMRWPGHIPQGSVCENRTISEDMYATILDIAGQESVAGAGMDGRSLVADFSCVKLTPQPDLHWYYPHYGIGQDPGSIIISGNYKLIEHYDPPRVELFNLSQDISETTDLSKVMPGKTEELRLKLHQWLESVDPVMHKRRPAR
jgi:arylsulfatase A-like enzyme